MGITKNNFPDDYTFLEFLENFDFYVNNGSDMDFLSPESHIGFTPTDDDLIKKYVEKNIGTNPYIPWEDKENIKVEVNNGMATLTGKVQSNRSKYLAYADAFWTSGVIDVVLRIRTHLGKLAT